MRIKWVKSRVTRARGPFIYLSPKGPFQWCSVGDICEVPDDVGYALLKKEPDIVEQVPDEPAPIIAEEKPKPGPRRRRAKVIRDKRQRTYEDK